MAASAQDQTLISSILAETWDRFYPRILWWANRETAVRPESAMLVYRELLSGPKEAMPYAVRLHKAMKVENAG